MRELQDRIRFSDTAAATTASATMTGNPALQNLQNLYKEQAQLLSNYREQRARLAVLALQQMQILNNDRQARKADLIDSQTALQDQISSLRNDIAQVEAARLQSQLSLQNIEKEVEQNRKSSEDQSQKVRSLDSALQKKKVSE